MVKCPQNAFAMSNLTDLRLSYQLIVLLPLGAVLLAAAVTDLRNQKVYNKLTYPAILGGLIIHGIVFGPASLGPAVLAILVAFIFGLLTMLPGWMGGGDVKLFMVVAAFTGLRGLGEIVFYSFITGATLSFIQAIFTGYALQLLQQMWYFLRGIFRVLYYQTTNVSYGTDPEESPSKFPFALAILAGAICAYSEARWGWPPLIQWALYGTIS